MWATNIKKAANLYKQHKYEGKVHLQTIIGCTTKIYNSIIAATAIIPYNYYGCLLNQVSNI